MGNSIDDGSPYLPDATGGDNVNVPSPNRKAVTVAPPLVAVSNNERRVDDVGSSPLSILEEMSSSDQCVAIESDECDDDDDDIFVASEILIGAEFTTAEENASTHRSQSGINVHATTVIRRV